ncbi:uncharacterized protein [Mytilus edulis]|uniref:N-acetyltransferase domain-containing protein n=1 Tax=Mytilus edulis TaxID=6550 RepID=A0A8S3S954_MYTED|nr:unnamed protein product [Mytilus edulis]
MLTSTTTSLLALPEMDTLATGRRVVIDYMTETELTKTYNMIQEAAKNGEGYGIDEFDSEKEFRKEIKGSHSFAIKCPDSGSFLAGVIIAVSKFYRGHGAIADPFVIVEKSERKQRLGEFALRKSLEFAKRLGYKGMYVDTFSNNVAMIKIIESIGGFEQVGCLPVGGKLQNGHVVGSVIFYCNFVDDNNNIVNET